MIGNAGAYEMSGNQVTIRPVVAKIPVVMKPGAYEVYEFKIEGNTLTLTSAATSEVRLNGAPSGRSRASSRPPRHASSQNVRFGSTSEAKAVPQPWRRRTSIQTLSCTLRRHQVFEERCGCGGSIESLSVERDAF